MMTRYKAGDKIVVTKTLGLDSKYNVRVGDVYEVDSVGPEIVRVTTKSGVSRQMLYKQIELYKPKGSPLLSDLKETLAQLREQDKKDRAERAKLQAKITNNAGVITSLKNVIDYLEEGE